jgi:hypothetical protein
MMEFVAHVRQLGQGDDSSVRGRSRIEVDDRECVGFGSRLAERATRIESRRVAELFGRRLAGQARARIE